MPQSSDPSQLDLSRRIVLRGAAVSGVALPLLAACGSDEPTGGTAGDGTEETATPEDSPTAAEESPTDDGAAAGLVSTSEVPVGGGTILQDEKIVVTQPAEGEFKAFTAVCTHQGCTVSSIADQEIVCGCHQSHYSIEDGSNVSGPAPSPLEEIAITVQGDQIVRG